MEVPGRASGHPGVRFEQTTELFGGWLPGSVLIRVLGSLSDADHCWWRGFVGGGDMGNEETLPEATRRNNHFWFANFLFRRRGFVVGVKMGNEVTQTPSREKKR